MAPAGRGVSQVCLAYWLLKWPDFWIQDLCHLGLQDLLEPLSFSGLPTHSDLQFLLRHPVLGQEGVGDSIHQGRWAMAS